MLFYHLFKNCLLLAVIFVNLSILATTRLSFSNPQAILSHVFWPGPNPAQNTVGSSFFEDLLDHPTSFSFIKGNNWLRPGGTFWVGDFDTDRLENTVSLKNYSLMADLTVYLDVEKYFSTKRRLFFSVTQGAGLGFSSANPFFDAKNEYQVYPSDEEATNNQQSHEGMVLSARTVFAFGINSGPWGMGASTEITQIKGIGGDSLERWLNLTPAYNVNGSIFFSYDIGV